MRQRAGRGFTLEELQAVKVNPKQARSIGIAVDHRRRDKSTQALEANTARLKTYLSKLIVFPIKGAKPRKGDTTDKEVLNKVSQLPRGQLLPIKH